MSESRKKIRKLNKYMCIGIGVIIMAFLIHRGRDAIAKYIEISKSHEVVMANTFYFSSDYLREVQDSVSGTELPQYMVNGWGGVNGITFGFEIRNYENQLLFNDQFQDIIYDVQFDFVDPETYEVIDKLSEDTKDSQNVKDIKKYILEGKLGATLKKNGSEDVIELSEYGLGNNQLLDKVLAGTSTFQADKYELSLNVAANEKISQDVALLITARSKNISYEKTLKLVVVFKYTQYDSYIHTKKFVNDTSPVDNSKKSDTQNQSALKYVVETADSTVDNYSNTDITLATKVICVEWQSDLLHIDRFDNNITLDSDNMPVTISVNTHEIHSYDKEKYNTYLNKLIAEVKKENEEKYKNILITDTSNDNKTFIFFDSLPYSRYEITFHKYSTAGYDKFTQKYLDANGSGNLNSDNDSEHYVNAVVVDLIE